MSAELSTGFEHTTEKVDDQVVIHLAGEIDLAAAPDLEAAIDAATENGLGSEVVLDFKDVTFLDSSGLRVLVTAHSALAEAGRSLSLANPSVAVSRILEITGLGKTLLAEG